VEYQGQFKVGMIGAPNISAVAI